MCGLVALLSPAVPISRDLLSEMRDRLMHRGPDSAGLWLEAGERVGLAHRRLAIIDRSPAADQPMAAADGEYRIVYNGEIYNYLELRDELARLGVRFRTRSDTEVLLAAYTNWGEAAFLRLNGMFAFAIWDSRRRLLTVVRDRFGEKPVFIGRGRFGTVAIASEMKAILAHPHVSTAESCGALHDFGAGLWKEDDNRTFFCSIERLPPAHFVVFDATGRERRRHRYWTPDYTNIDYRITAEEAQEQFASLLSRSVKLRMRSDVPVGSSLSGGLDSSMIVAELAAQRPADSPPQKTFSACIESDQTLSEEPEVDCVVEHVGVTSYKVFPAGDDLIRDSRRLHWHQEEPFLSASIFMQWSVARLAKEHETIVLLDGQGADEVLGGYQSLFPLHQLDLLDRGEIEQARLTTGAFNDRLQAAAGRYTDAKRRFNPDVAYPLSQIDALASSPPGVWHNDYGAGVAPAVLGGRFRRVLSETLLYNGLPMLLRYADRNAMAFGREPRAPYLDHDLVDFCIRLPDGILLRGGWQKWILRETIAGKLPKSIAWRADKVGYAAPLDEWLRNSIREWASERLFDASTSALPGYDRQSIESLWQAHQSRQEDHSWALWRWISLAEWMDIHRHGYWRCGLAA